MQTKLTKLLLIAALTSTSIAPTRAEAEPTNYGWEHPRWGITAGVMGDILLSDAFNASVGVRAGFRYWPTRWLILNEALEYRATWWTARWTDDGRRPGDGEDGARFERTHSLALITRIELSDWTDDGPRGPWVWGAMSVPRFTLYPLVGPVVMVGGRPGFGAGLRVGGGIQTNSSRWLGFGEIGYQWLKFRRETVNGAFISLGIGF